MAECMVRWRLASTGSESCPGDESPLQASVTLLLGSVFLALSVIFLALCPAAFFNQLAYISFGLFLFRKTDVVFSICSTQRLSVCFTINCIFIIISCAKTEFLSGCRLPVTSVPFLNNGLCTIPFVPSSRMIMAPIFCDRCADAAAEGCNPLDASH